MAPSTSQSCNYWLWGPVSPQWPRTRSVAMAPSSAPWSQTSAWIGPTSNGSQRQSWTGAWPGRPRHQVPSPGARPLCSKCKGNGVWVGQEARALGAMQSGRMGKVTWMQSGLSSFCWDPSRVGSSFPNESFCVVGQRTQPAGQCSGRGGHSAGPGDASPD